MSWPCRLLTAEEYAAKRSAKALQIGDMWFADSEDPIWKWELQHLTAYYEEHNKPRRPPLVVMLPSMYPFCVDSCFWRNGKPCKDGWKVTGDPPNITVEPSINIVGDYHGWLRNGVISDDVEGRVFK
jgi:hypothetical protein